VRVRGGSGGHGRSAPPRFSFGSDDHGIVALLFHRGPVTRQTGLHASETFVTGTTGSLSLLSSTASKELLHQVGLGLGLGLGLPVAGGLHGEWMLWAGTYYIVCVVVGLPKALGHLRASFERGRFGSHKMLWGELKFSSRNDAAIHTVPVSL
jgi:hypothetical protein